MPTHNAPQPLALLYHALGFNVLPISPSKNPVSGHISKPPSRSTRGHGAVSPWFAHRQTSDDVTRLFASHFSPDATLVGLIIGDISPVNGYRLLILDFDSHALFESMRPLFPFIPNTWLVRTRRGFHVYLLIPKSLVLPSGSRWRVIKGLDIKRSNGYVVAPASSDASLGLSYDFVQGPTHGIALPLVLDSLAPLSPLIEDVADTCRSLPDSSLAAFSAVETADVQPWAPSRPAEGASVPSHKRIRSHPDGRPYGLSVKLWHLLIHNRWQSTPRSVSASDSSPRSLSAINSDVPPRYRSRSEAEQSVILALAGQGYSYSQTKRLFDLHAHPASKYKTHPSSASYLKHSYGKAVSHLSKHRHPAVTRYLSALASYDWREASPCHLPVDRLVLRTLLSSANRLNKFPTFTMSHRELARLCSLSSSTIQRSLIRLSSLGLVSVSSSVPSRVPTLRKPSAITLIFPFATASSPLLPLPSSQPLTPAGAYVPVQSSPDDNVTHPDLSPLPALDSSDRHHPLWSHTSGGLGEKGRILYHALLASSARSPSVSGGLKVSDLVTLTGFPRSTIFHLRARMLALGVISAMKGFLHAEPLPPISDHSSSRAKPSPSISTPTADVSTAGQGLLYPHRPVSLETKASLSPMPARASQKNPDTLAVAETRSASAPLSDASMVARLPAHRDQRLPSYLAVVSTAVPRSGPRAQTEKPHTAIPHVHAYGCHPVAPDPSAGHLMPLPLFADERDSRNTLVFALHQMGFSPRGLASLNLQDCLGRSEPLFRPYVRLRLASHAHASDRLFFTLPDKWGRQYRMTSLGLARLISHLKKRPPRMPLPPPHSCGLSYDRTTRDALFLDIA